MKQVKHFIGQAGFKGFLFVSQLPPARHRLRLQARRAGKKLRKRNPLTAEGDTLFVVDLALATFAVSKERSFPQRGIGLFAFLQERQKYPDYPVNPVLFEQENMNFVLWHLENR
jgi:hypothetical protein